MDYDNIIKQLELLSSNLADVIPVDARLKFFKESAESAAKAIKELIETIKHQETTIQNWANNARSHLEACKELKDELNECYVDENNYVWTRPTAEVFANTCKDRQKLNIELKDAKKKLENETARADNCFATIEQAHKDYRFEASKRHDLELKLAKIREALND